MGEEGRGSLEIGDSSGEVFWMRYPNPFLQYYYDTFPAEMIQPAQPKASPVNIDSPQDDEVKSEPLVPMEMHPDFPNLRLSKAVVFEHFQIIILTTLTSSRQIWTIMTLSLKTVQNR